jgi:hypothetical protein
MDLSAGIVGLLQAFCSFVRLLEQHGVTLCSSGALRDKAHGLTDGAWALRSASLSIATSCSPALIKKTSDHMTIGVA